jgi:simple sugar transport system substrate-binding protein
MRHSSNRWRFRHLLGALAATLALFCTTPFAAGKIVFISHASDANTWWNVIKNSLKHASEDFGVEVEYRNPKSGELKDMVLLIDQAAAEKPAGIITTIADYNLLKDHLTNVAITQKIPLITVNSGTDKQSESVGALLHIGQPEAAAGKRAGARAAQAGIKSFVCLNHYSNNTASHERCLGFAQTLGLQKAEELDLPEDDKQIERKILDYFAQHPNTEAVLSLGPQPAHVMLEIIRSGKLAKTPFFVTFDLSAQIIDGIKKGHIAFAIDQQPYLQGYLSAALLAEKIKGGSDDLQLVKLMLYSEKTLHARMSKYGLELMGFGGRHIDSGPGLVTKTSVDKVERYSGTFR